MTAGSYRTMVSGSPTQTRQAGVDTGWGDGCVLGAISIALQFRVPLEAYVSKFVNMRFEPSGMTDDPDIRMAQSMMDYIFRRLAWITCRTRSAQGWASSQPMSGQASSTESTEQAAQSPAAPHESDQLDAPVVPHDGTASVPASVHSSAGLL